MGLYDSIKPIVNSDHTSDGNANRRGGRTSTILSFFVHADDFSSNPVYSSDIMYFSSFRRQQTTFV